VRKIEKYCLKNKEWNHEAIENKAMQITIRDGNLHRFILSSAIAQKIIG
jgi:hypothetical protein